MRFLALTILSLCTLNLSTPAHASTETSEASAIFAGGCFWCMEAPFEARDGVYEAISGYSGGHTENPTYKQVTRGGTGHLEVVKVSYDPSKISYAELVEIFWRNVDPHDSQGQFCDKGESYTTAIFVENESEREIAETSKKELEKRFGGTLVTPILDRKPFYQAEAYHQDYYKNSSYRYKYYRSACGRDKRLNEVWGNEAGGH